MGGRNPEPIELHLQLVKRERHIQTVLDAMEHENPDLLAESLVRTGLPTVKTTLTGSLTRIFRLREILV